MHHAHQPEPACPFLIACVMSATASALTGVVVLLVLWLR